ncbi:MAG: dTDP-4-dehydrorhamnose 3,5-epimerase family protein [Magnetococcales bacterium]|nr:dTDP-4-dehydrorhamnose 3,5-epimerase family protein [Magnetococcales bacterium]MBF0321411.1 dTDP-4-dehydrorhamnose 3,5-epimerase family protein [Magnetococcales bacterium]
MSSPLRVEKTKLPGVLLIHPLTVFEDFRGYYVETYNREAYHAAGITMDFVQDDLSSSHLHVLRGIHGDGETWKLVSCPYGRFYLVVVNCDPNSPLFGQWVPFTLSSVNRRQVLIPPWHGTSHLILSEFSIFNYKQTTYYDRPSQFTYRWDDPRFGIYWPVTNPILSPRDSMTEIK